MSDTADFQRLIGEQIRYGTIASVDFSDPDDPTCTVATGDIVTPDLPWLAARAGAASRWSPPTVGEQCLLICPEGDTSAGVVLLGLYSSANPAPSTDAGVDLIRYADGAEIRYDATSHVLSAILPAGGRIDVTAPGGTTINGPLTVNGPVTIEGTATVSDDVVAGGKSLKTHRHSGVQSGGAQSGPPA